MSRSFSENVRRVSPRNFAEKTLGEISDFLFFSAKKKKKKKIRARGVPRRNAKKELFSWADLCIAPVQEQTTSWGQHFYININLLSLWSFAVSYFFH